jgi:nucleotide-binding universal stress UspA family protein
MPYAARILVPTDFSPLSSVALEHAIALGSLCRASIHLLHVRTDARGQVNDDDRLLAGLVSRCHAEAIVVTSQVCSGQPAAIIAQVAADRAVDLIVLGTHGRHGVAHLILGSVAEHIVRTAPCPVLTVRGLVPDRVEQPTGDALVLLPD